MRGDLGDAPVALVARRVAQLQADAQVLLHRHVRVEGVVLKDHRHVAVLGRQVGDDALADHDLAVGHLFEPGDDAQQRRLAAARRAHEHHELAVADLHGHVVDREDVLVERLAHAVQDDARHVTPPV